MRERLITLYIGLTAAAAVTTVVVDDWFPTRPVEWVWWVALLVLGAAIAAEVLAVPLPEAGYVSAATVAHIVGALLLPPGVAAVVSGTAVLIVQLLTDRRPSRLIFNTSCTVTTVGLTALLANELGLSGSALGTGGWTEILAFFAVACVNYSVNALLVAGIIALANDVSVWQVMRENGRYSAPAEFACAVIGGVIALVVARVPHWLPAALFPAIIAQLTLQYIAASARKTADLQYQALHDLLTDLPNRTLLRDRLRLELATAGREGAPLALLVLDLDRFKEVNDTFGHHVGDVLLREVGPRLQSVLRTGDTLARLGGDEFAILMPGAGVPAARAVAAEIARSLEQPFLLEGHSLDIGASVGIAAYPEHGEEADLLLLRADVAMYIAKRASSGYAVYDPAQDPNSPDRLALIGDLRRAIDGGELALYFQPKVDLHTRQLCGVEALVRWPHPQRGHISPDEFITLAEQTGLIRSLSQWVLETALRQCRAWDDGGLGVPVAVNLSMLDLQDPNLPTMLGARLAACGVAPTRLRVEITESSLMADPERALKVVKRLREMGVRISIDDFGTGYSSLAYLKRLPVDELKIDRSFVRNLAVDEGDQAIVRSTIGLAHELGLQVVTEGVEDQTTWDLLRAFGCDRAQGYFIGYPQPAEDLLCWFETWQGTRVAGAGGQGQPAAMPAA